MLMSVSKVNGVMIISSDQLDLDPNYLLYVRRPPPIGVGGKDEKWILWDKVEASSRSAATQYFAGKYPREERKIVAA